MQSRNHVHIFHVDLVLKLQFSLSKILIVVEIPCFHVNDSLVHSPHKCWDTAFKSMTWCKKWDYINYSFRLVDVKILDVGFDLLGYYFHFTWACAYCLFSLSLLWGFYYLFWAIPGFILHGCCWFVEVVIGGSCDVHHKEGQISWKNGMLKLYLRA